MTSLARQSRILDSAVADLRRTLFRMSETPIKPLSLADELGGSIKDRALAKAYDRFCQHHDEARFHAEVRAIKGCNMVGGAS